MGRCLIGRATGVDLTVYRQADVVAWLRSLQLDPTRYGLALAVTQDGDTYALHLSEYLRDERDTIVLDVAADRPAQKPVVVPVEAGSWPGWLTGLNVPGR